MSAGTRIVHRTGFGPALALGLALGLAALGWARCAQGEAGPSHSFLITYRDFGQVTSTSSFRDAGDYALRFEGCFAKQGDAAICAFTLRAERPLSLTNLANASHAARADGSSTRTCCLFVQDRPEGFPILAPGQEAGGAAILRRRLTPGQAVGVMLRVPNYRLGAAVSAITFSPGAGAPGFTLPAAVQELR